MSINKTTRNANPYAIVDAIMKGPIIETIVNAAVALGKPLTEEDRQRLGELCTGELVAESSLAESAVRLSRETEATEYQRRMLAANTNKNTEKLTS